MLERKKEFAVILAFDVPVSKEAKQEAEHVGVKIFESDVIYQLTDMFAKYLETLHSEGKSKAKEIAVFPCQLTLIPEFIFNKRSPIIIGVRVDAGILKCGTPIVVPSQEFVCIFISSRRRALDLFVCHVGTLVTVFLRSAFF